VPPGLGERLTYLAAATVVGLLWAFGAAITGRPFEVHGHIVLGALTGAALAAGGFDLHAWVRWRQDVTWVMRQKDIPPDRQRDLRALLTALHSGDPRVMRALRERVEELDREG
jgi:hypothetical protein